MKYPRTLVSGLIFSLFTSACSATLPVKKEPAVAPPTAAKELRAAESLVRARDYRKAVPRLKRLALENPDSDVSDDAHFWLAEIATVQGNHKEAILEYRAVTEAQTASPLEARARINLTRLLLKQGLVDEAEKEAKLLARMPAMPENLQIEAKLVQYEVLAAKGNYVEALVPLVLVAEQHPNPDERTKYRQRALDFLDSKLSSDDMKEVASGSKYGFLQPIAKFRYGLALAEQKDFSRARSQFEDVVELSPGSDLAERSARLIEQIDARNRVDPRTIGVILPLSGPQAAIGQKALRAVQLALGVYGKAQSNFRIAVIDSEGNPDVARRGVEELVQKDNVIALVGGLLSKTAVVEASRAEDFGVPAIMLSQKSGLTQAGDSIFRNAVTSQTQVRALLDVVMGKLGMKRFAILFPNDAYGVEYANFFWDEAMSRGGQITGAQPYDPKETDFRGHVQRLAGMFYSEDRASEYRHNLKLYTEKNPKRGARQAAPALEELMPPIIDFDAIFIPDTARAVGQIAPMLAYNNIRDVRLLGTNAWNSPALIQRGQKFVEKAVFVDSALTNDPSYRSSPFFSAFVATFEEEPGLTELQAYDSALILRQLIAGGETTRVGLRERMASLRDFPAATGRLSITDQREIERPLTALTVENGAIVPFESIQR
ncbi:MAG TPA: penicillin-binding protein activator [Bdellovibrionales bacterium]|nr:penicillin-binding protein activator [Bdellovibrionales bacterium]